MNFSARRSRPFARSVLLVALTGSLLLAAPAAALAGKPGGGGTTSGSATVQATPNPVAAYEHLTVSGGGYAAGIQLQVQIVTSTSIGYIYAATDSAGRFSLDTSISTAGTASVKVIRPGRRGGTVLASTSVSVY